MCLQLIKLLTVAFCVEGRVPGLLIIGLSSVSDVNDRFGLDVRRSSSKTFDTLDEYSSFFSVLLGLVSEASVLLMLVDGVTIFNELDDTMVFRHSSGCFVVTRSEPLLRDSVRVLLFAETFVCLTFFVSVRISFRGINRRIRPCELIVVVCFGLPKCSFDGLFILP